MHDMTESKAFVLLRDREFLKQRCASGIEALNGLDKRRVDTVSSHQRSLVAKSHTTRQA